LGFVKLLGGFMTIKSRLGAGTTVRVSLPQTVVDDTSCMSLAEPEKLCLAAYLHFDKFTNPMVREYYNAVVFNMVKGLKVQMHRVDNADNLNKLANSTNLTHLFVGEEEYASDPELIEDLANEMIVVVVANPSFQLPKDSGARIMLKPFYCFPVAAILNAGLNKKDLSQGHMLLEGITALVVDDEPMNLIVAKSIFGRYHMIIDTAASGPESIKSCRAKKYDIVFMDHMMSGMDGVEAMKKIKADVTSLNRDVPIIALTANAMSSAKQMFMNEGFDGFVSKPIEIEELERVLKKTLPKSAITYEDITRKHTRAAAPVVTEEAPAEETTEEKPRPKTLRGKLTEAGIDVQTGLHYCAGDLDFYETLLLQVGTEGKNKIESLKSFYAQQDWKNYEILIHSTKSSMKTIGALTLSEDALKLEMAAKGEDADYIKANHDRVIADYDKTITSILAALDKSDAPKEAPAEASKDEEKKEDDEEVFEFNPDSDDEILEFGPENGEELS
jgi:CheY-like chemotaxis protein/HPt (histidine-containing phosphotransfer) domain-containing protein